MMMQLYKSREKGNIMKYDASNIHKSAVQGRHTMKGIGGEGGKEASVKVSSHTRNPISITFNIIHLPGNADNVNTFVEQLPHTKCGRIWLCELYDLYPQYKALFTMS